MNISLAEMLSTERKHEKIKLNWNEWNKTCPVSCKSADNTDTVSDSRLTAVFYPRSLWCHLLCLTGSILLRFPPYNTCGWSRCQPDRRRQGGNLWSRLESGYRHTGSREGMAYWSTKPCDYIQTGDCWHHWGKGVPMSESVCLCISDLLQSVRQREQSEECIAVFTYLNM